GQEDGEEQRDRRDAEEHELGREREPVDGRSLQRGDHLSEKSPGRFLAPDPKEWSVIAAGQNDRKIRQATRGTRMPSSAGRRSRTESAIVGGGSRWSTAEISRSMYMAAKTIATAPSTVQAHPWTKTPSRIRNSPANAPEPGTASPMIPVVIRMVARAGRPR